MLSCVSFCEASIQSLIASSSGPVSGLDMLKEVGVDHTEWLLEKSTDLK